MFKKSSRAKNIRRKIETTDDEPTEEVDIKKTITSTLKKKKQLKKQVNPLSFEDEEQQESFQIKKIKPSRTIQLPDNLVDAMDIDVKSSYDETMLNQLKAGTPNLPASVRSSLNKEDALLHEKFPSMNALPSASTGIPDASAILAAKKKREQMRKGGFNVVENEDGFIPLDEEDNTGSRLVREEDDIADDGEAEFEKYVGDKYAFNKSTAKKQERERREGVREMIEEAEEEDEEEQSEDMARWENDMIKYGGVKTNPTGMDPYSTPANYRPAQIPETAALPTLSDMMTSMDLSITQINESIQHYESNLAESLKTIENSTQIESDLDRQIEKSSERYNYFQGLAQFVNDLGEFLDAKFPDLEQLEAQVHDILATRTDIVTSRRWQHQLDDLCMFYIVKEAEKEEIDEFGRVRNSATALQRRQSERQKRMQRLVESEGDEVIREQGLFTDDEMTEEYEIKRDTQLQDIQTTSIEQLLSDVSPEFSSLRAVKDKFEAWKLDFTEDYEKAFGSLSLPGAFEFYIRTELVSWDPFSEPMDLDGMQWHSVLSEYGVSREHEDPDVDMLNKVVEKTIIKKVKSLLDTLDAASSRQMRYAAQIVEQISYYVDTHEKAYQDLTMDIVDTLDKQLSRFIEPIATAIPKSNLDEASIQAKHRFFWSQCKYLKTLMVWRRHIPKIHLDRLGSMVMDRVITPILKPETYPTDLHLQNEALLLLSHLQK
ncbi:nineteen complex-related protein 2-domain-containing protein [Gilbertella persicaria]|nr:nineteen complex-related protein 2-domain-containing protein [Gilbertella persicaria]KAI8086841.1 nineteen complex-related protein 2-domain-containing protein [Gilbertella persicaria]